MSFEPIYIDMQVAESDQQIDVEPYEQIIPAQYNWMGRNAKLVQTFPLFSVALKDTDFNTWTPSTTAKEILASVELGTFIGDLSSYDYTIWIRFETDLKYVSGATMKITPKFQVIDIYQQVAKRPATNATYLDHDKNGNFSTTQLLLAPFIRYYSSTGGLSMAYSGAYGIYCNAVSPTFSSNTGDPVTVSVKRPTISARCSTTYFATARAAELDKTNSLLKISCNIYRSEKGSVMQAAFDKMIERAYELDGE